MREASKAARSLPRSGPSRKTRGGLHVLGGQSGALACRQDAAVEPCSPRCGERAACSSNSESPVGCCSSRATHATCPPNPPRSCWRGHIPKGPEAASAPWLHSGLCRQLFLLLRLLRRGPGLIFVPFFGDAKSEARAPLTQARRGQCLGDARGTKRVP